MEFKGTKGKWEYSSGDNNSVDIVLPNESTITVDRSGRYSGKHVMEREEMEANALLISKAPEMLDMLNRLNELIKHLGGTHYCQYSESKDLIKKATEI